MDELDKIFDEAKDILNEVFDMFTHKPDDPNSKSPCGKCLGSLDGCMDISKRDPKVECGCFQDKDKPLNITII